ncbi:MAG: hypothetical protein AAF519_13455, partial [Bacteroidota bacterium]
MFSLRIVLTATLISVSLSFSIGQTVRIADNNFNAPTGPNIFPTLQEAVDAADPGDIIYVQPSPTQYGNLTTDKPLIIKGIGFNLDKDIPHQSSVSGITLTNNVDNTANASGTEIEGLTTTNLVLGLSTTTTYSLDNVVIKNSLITSGLSARVTVNNLLINDCQTGFLQFNQPVLNSEIRNNLLGGSGIFLFGTSNSLIVTNNIIYASISKSSEGDNVIIQHNNFIGSRPSTNAFGNLIDAIVANNIFYGRTPSRSASGGSTSASFQRNIFTNNLSFETGNDELPPAGGGVGNSGDGNIVGSSPMFTNVPIINTWSADYNFTLQAGSPVFNAASDGSDIGITGGPYSWTESNFSLNTTSIPTIQTF